MSDYQILKQEIIALDHLINRQLELIKGLKEMLRSASLGLDQEVALLRELTNEIIALRELREVQFRKRASMSRLEINSAPIESDHSIWFESSQ